MFFFFASLFSFFFFAFALANNKRQLYFLKIVPVMFCVFYIMYQGVDLNERTPCSSVLFFCTRFFFFIYFLQYFISALHKNVLVHVIQCLGCASVYWLEKI